LARGSESRFISSGVATPMALAACGLARRSSRAAVAARMTVVVWPIRIAADPEWIAGGGIVRVGFISQDSARGGIDLGLVNG